MISEKVIVSNPSGLHLRPASLLCKTAVKFKSSITFRHLNSVANAKSVLSVLGACIKSGDELVFICDGVDETEALNTIIELIKNGLGE